MIRVTLKEREAAEREALRRRVKQMYSWFNRSLWDKCFSLLDPRLVERERVHLPLYTSGLQAFKESYGAIHPWYIRINLYLDASTGKREDRPFAYVYVIWQDDSHGFHMFRERWVRQGGLWFTRVVGLVSNRRDPVRNKD